MWAVTAAKEPLPKQANNVLLGEPIWIQLMWKSGPNWIIIASYVDNILDYNEDLMF